MNDYYSALLIALIVIVLLVALTIPAVMMSFKRKQDTSNSGTAPTTGAGDDKSKPAAKAAEPEKKKAKEKKLEVTWSWWLFLYSFLIAGFVIPSLMADSLSTRDTWLLVILVSVAATYAVATMVKYQFDFDDAVGKVNKIAVGLLILGIAFLLFQNNFSTTATLKDAGTRTSGFTSGIKEFLAGSRKSVPTTSSTNTTPSGTLPKLSIDDFLDNVPGRFPAMTIAAGSSLGPVNDYDDSCLKHAQGGGSGTLVIMTRPDFTSEPVRATSDANGVTVPGHDGPAYQYFYVAEGENILLNLQRREGDSSCNNKIH